MVESSKFGPLSSQYHLAWLLWLPTQVVKEGNILHRKSIQDNIFPSLGCLHPLDLYMCQPMRLIYLLGILYTTMPCGSSFHVVHGELPITVGTWVLEVFLYILGGSGCNSLLFHDVHGLFFSLHNVHSCWHGLLVKGLKLRCCTFRLCPPAYQGHLHIRGHQWISPIMMPLPSHARKSTNTHMAVCPMLIVFEEHYPVR